MTHGMTAEQGRALRECMVQMVKLRIFLEETLPHMVTELSMLGVVAELASESKIAEMKFARVLRAHGIK
jgi:hypothetical protein